MNLKKFIQVNPFRFYLYLLGAILVPALNVLNTFLVQLEADIVLSRNLRNFILITVITFVIILVSYLINSCIIYLNKSQEQDLNDQIRTKIVSHYYHDGKNHEVGAMQNRLTNDLSMINDNYYEPIFNLIYGIVTMIAVLIYLILLNWQLLIVIALMVAVSLVLPKITEKPLQKATQLISDRNQAYLDSLNDWLSGLEQIRQFLAGAKLFAVTENASKKLEDATVKQTYYIKLLNAFNGIVSALFGFILFVLTGYLVKNGAVTVGTLLIVGNFRFYLNASIEYISNSWGQMKGTKKLIEEVNETAAAVPAQSNEDEATPKGFATQDLELQFPNGEKLTYPDIQVKNGEKILLTGDSGAGKSTLFKLILGELKPTNGKVIFQDEDGQAIKPDMSRIDYIPQDPVVFPATIADNITMFDDQLNNRVEQVVQEVNFIADINKFKDGLKQELNLDNLNISGGQRQKIVLARAKIHDSDIILIDEGTSAIDSKGTKEILNNLLKSKATIVFIAHNFSSELQKIFDREIHLSKN